MIAEKNKVVSLTYRLTQSDVNGALIEEVKENQPFTFVFGAGNLIAGFEQNVINLKVGDAFAFDVKSGDAYGEYNADGVVKLPISVFHMEGVLDEEICKVGNIVPMQNENGEHYNGTIKEVTAETVVMDFNHPLAGMDLHFKGSVVGIREATAQELEHGHVHQEHGHAHPASDGDHSCGCGC